MNSQAGRVLVVPSAELDRLGRFQGYCVEVDRYLAHLLKPGIAEFRVRAEMEIDPHYKQIIPYVVFVAGQRVFCYTRGKAQGETRLHSLRSLGVGGHVDEEDAQGRTSLEAYEEALRRELDEEVEIEGGGSMRRVGLINDDTTPVGQVHLGVVHLWSLSNERLSPREEGLVDAGFEEIEAVADSLTRFESWSQVCIESLLRPMLARGAGLRMS